MKITRMNNVNWGPRSLTKATFDIETTEGFILRDFQMKEGQFGIFVEGPQKPCKPYTTKEGKAKEWTDVISIFAKKGLKEELIQMASEAYDPSGEVRSKGGASTIQVDSLDELKDLNLPTAF